MHFVQKCPQLSRILIETIDMNERIFRSDVLVVIHSWSVNDRDQIVVECFVELLGDVIAACVRLETEMELKRGHVISFTLTVRSTPM